MFHIKDFTSKYPSQKSLDQLDEQFFQATDIRVLCIANTKYEETRKGKPLMLNIELAEPNVDLLKDYLQTRFAISTQDIKYLKNATKA